MSGSQRVKMNETYQKMTDDAYLQFLKDRQPNSEKFGNLEPLMEEDD